MNSDTFVEILSDLDYEPRSYSGRNMFGRQCVGIEVEDLHELYDIGYNVAEAIADRGMSTVASSPGTPVFDQLGRGIIVYWPNMDWPS